MTSLLLIIATAYAASTAISGPSFDHVTDPTFTANPDEIRARITDSLASGGLDVAKIGESGDYRVEAIVRSAQIRYLAPRAVEVAVEWRVSSHSGGPVLYSVVTRGNAEGQGVELRDLAMQAFADASTHLSSRQRLRDVVANPPAPAAPATGPSFDATLHMRGCVRPPLHLPSDIGSTFDAIVVVHSTNAVGTGVSVSPDGFVVTAAHVVPRGEAIEVSTHAGRSLPATVIRRDIAQDVAILHVDGLSANCLALQSTMPEIGTDLFVIGTPAGLDYSVSKGVVSGVRALEDHRFLQTDASISPGASGGPMLDTKGSVIGIVSWKIRAAGFEGLGFGVPSPAVANSLVLANAEHSDTTWPPDREPERVSTALDPAVVDTPDPSHFAAVAKTQAAKERGNSRRVSGFILLGVGAGVAGGTALAAGNSDHASDLLWTTLGVGNVLGWAAALGGVTLVGVSFIPVSDGETTGLGITGEF